MTSLPPKGPTAKQQHIGHESFNIGIFDGYIQPAEKVDITKIKTFCALKDDFKKVKLF